MLSITTLSKFLKDLAVKLENDTLNEDQKRRILYFFLNFKYDDTVDLQNMNIEDLKKYTYLGMFVEELVQVEEQPSSVQIATNGEF